MAPSRCEHGRYLGKTATFKTKSISGVRKEEPGAFAAEETRNQCGRSKDPRAAPERLGTCCSGPMYSWCSGAGKRSRTGVLLLVTLALGQW